MTERNILHSFCFTAMVHKSLLKLKISLWEVEIETRQEWGFINASNGSNQMVDKERQKSRAVKTILCVPAWASIHTPPLCFCATPTPAWSATLDKTHAMWVPLGQLKTATPVNLIKPQFSRPISCWDTFQSARPTNKGD